MGLEARPAFACVQSGWRPAPPGPRHHGSRPRRGAASLQGGSGAQGGTADPWLSGGGHTGVPLAKPCLAPWLGVSLSGHPQGRGHGTVLGRSRGPLLSPSSGAQEHAAHQEPLSRGTLV